MKNKQLRKVAFLFSKHLVPQMCLNENSILKMYLQFLNGRDLSHVSFFIQKDFLQKTEFEFSKHF